MEFEPSKEDLQQLREWLQKMPHLIQDYDDQFLAGIVRAKKGSLQKTKTCIENLNAMGMEYPEILSSYDPLDQITREARQVWLTFPLPKRSPEGYTIFLACLNPKFSDPSKSNAQLLSKCIILSFYVLLWENEFGSGQWKLLLDFKGVSLAHLNNITPMTIVKMIKLGESKIPIRIHSSTNFNVPTVVEYLVNLFKLAAKKKLTDRIFVYNSSVKLSEIVPQKMLPREYGGDEESILVLNENWMKKIDSYRQKFLEEEQKMRKLDALRPRKADDEMIGTFRQLKVD